jgi:hypothetical protein
MSNGKPGRAPEEAKRTLFIELISAGRQSPAPVDRSV